MDELLARRRTFLIHNMLFFWPVVTSGDDVQRLTMIGYYVCVLLALQNFVIAVSSFLGAQAFAQRRNIVLFGIAAVVFYLLAACGLRLRSVAVAVMLTLVQLISLIEERFWDGKLPLGTAFVLVVLLIVLRGIYLAAQWERQHGLTDPLQYNVYFNAETTNRQPAAIWSRLKYLFWIIGILQIGSALFAFYLHYQDAGVP